MTVYVPTKANHITKYKGFSKVQQHVCFSCTDDGNPPVGKSSRTNFSMSFVQVNRGGSMPELPRISVISKMRVLSLLTI